ncbi:hypothetical protein FRC12_023109 [Ceratobasidium sp. 428]|nr:hypothetical protein FRC12_023109 [Ceratobasidium sp. 428]
MRTGSLGRIGGAKEEGEGKRCKEGIDVGQRELPSNTVAQGSQETEQAAAMSISDLGPDYWRERERRQTEMVAYAVTEAVGDPYCTQEVSVCSRHMM